MRALPPALLPCLAFGLLVAASCTGSHPPATEDDAATCSNNIDDDNDGLVDCHDPACAVFPFCGVQDAGPVDMGLDDAGDVGPIPDAGACTAPLDVVLVVDVSTSMAAELGAIRSGVTSLWDTAHTLSTDAQISMVVFVDDVLAIDGPAPNVLDGGCMPFTSADELGTQLDFWQMFCATNQSPVSHLQNHDCAENSLDAIVAATMCPTRAGSTRVIIHVTDDTFVERPGVLSGEWGGGVHVGFNYLETTTALTDGRFHVGVFAETGMGDDCGAGRSPDVGRGFSGPYSMMASLPDATGGHFWDLREVRAGRLDMMTSINDFLRSAYCAH